MRNRQASAPAYQNSLDRVMGGIWAAKNMLGLILKVLVVLCVAVGVLYVSVWLLLIGGVTDAINLFKSPSPVSMEDVGVSILKMLSSLPVAIFCGKIAFELVDEKGSNTSSWMESETRSEFYARTNPHALAWLVRIISVYFDVIGAIVKPIDRWVDAADSLPEPLRFIVLFVVVFVFFALSLLPLLFLS
jgi:hypothetical protein